MRDPLLFLLFMLCISKPGQKDAKSSVQQSLTAQSKLKGHRYSDLQKQVDTPEEVEKFVGKGGLYEFHAPKGFFYRTAPNQYFSEKLKAKISIHTNHTQYFDKEGIFSKKEFLSINKKGLSVVYFVDKGSWFALSGYDLKKNIIYRKGFYDELVSMQGRDHGEPHWVWSRSAVIEIAYPPSSKTEMDKWVSLISKSFKCDLILI